MFESLIKQLEEMNKNKFSYSFQVETDDKGYYDKECPNKDCLKKFKVYADDWNKLNKGDFIFCPYCGKSETTNKWWTTEQIENSKQQAMSDIKYKVHSAIKKDSVNFNNKHKKGFISINMKVGNMSKPVLLPLTALESLEQEIVCQNCKNKYAVIGCSYYCPFCGEKSAPIMIKNSLNAIKAKIKGIENIYNALKIENIDDAEYVKQSMIETSFGELVSAFQKLCEGVYSKLPNSILPLKKNVFQRLDDGAKLWKNAIGQDYSTWLNSSELTNLRIYFQQRHILEHNQGIIDNEYINKTHDKNYNIGQRIVIKIEDVVEFTNLIEKLSNEILKYY